MGDDGIDESSDGGCPLVQIGEHVFLVFFPSAIDREKDRRLVGKPAIEGLRRKACAARDLVAVGTGKPVNTKFLSGGFDKFCTRVFDGF